MMPILFGEGREWWTTQKVDMNLIGSAVYLGALHVPFTTVLEEM